MSEAPFDPKAFVLRKDIHPIELWSPGARIRIHVPAVPIAGTIIAAVLGALAGGAVVAVFAFSSPLADPFRWAAVGIAAAAGGLWAARKFREMFEEHDVTFDWTASSATFRHGSSVRTVTFQEIRGVALQGLKTLHEPGRSGSVAASYTAYWCRLEAQLSGGRVLILEGDPERDPLSPRTAIEAMGRELARALSVDFHFDEYREMTAREYLL